MSLAWCNSESAKMTTAVLLLIAALALVHGLWIVTFTPRKHWAQTVKWYRWSKRLSWFMLGGAVLLVIFAMVSDGYPLKQPLSASVRRFVQENAYISGTLVVALTVALVVVILEQLWINPTQRTTNRPGGVWYAWFLVTFSASLMVEYAGERLVPPARTTPHAISLMTSEATQLIAEADKNLQPLRTAATSAADARKAVNPADEAAIKQLDQQSAAADQALKKAEAKIAQATKIKESLATAANGLAKLKALESASSADHDDKRSQLRAWIRDPKPSTPDSIPNDNIPQSSDTASASAPEIKDLEQRATQTKSLVLAMAASAASGPMVLDVAAILTVGGLYALWTLSLLFRRVTEGDRIVGTTARDLAFFKIFDSRLPAQCVVVGPRHSGKTELLRNMPECVCPGLDDQQATAPTQGARTARLSKHTDCDVSLVDCGGEFVGDQLDLLNNLRTDCLLVVMCASHLKAEDTHLNDPYYWDVSRIHMLVNTKYDSSPSTTVSDSVGDSAYRIPTIGDNCAAFFQTLYYATNRAGTSGDKSKALSAQDLAAQVSRVIVVLNHRDISADGSKAFERIPLECLETLARSIYARFVRSDQRVGAHAASAALKIVMRPQDRQLDVIAQSRALQNSNRQFIHWEPALAGLWAESAKAKSQQNLEMKGVPTSNAAHSDQEETSANSGVRP